VFNFTIAMCIVSHYVGFSNCITWCHS
jgi:hypothetical protein